MNVAVSRAAIADGGITELGKLYHFLALGFAHPDDSTLAWMQGATVADEVLEIVATLPQADGLAVRLTPLLKELMDMARRLTVEELESTYINMFSCGFPQVLCPAYGSLYTATSDAKRLEEMIAVKAFYETCGVRIAGDFKDLPDHVCVEFEFLQYLSCEEAQAQDSGELTQATAVARHSLHFLDRHTLGLIDGMAGVAAEIQPRNLYCLLIDVAANVVRYDRDHLFASIGNNTPVQKGDEQ